MGARARSRLRLELWVQEELAPRPRSRAPIGLYLFTLFCALYLLGMSGTFLGNADSVFMFGVAESLARARDVAISPRIADLQEPKDAFEFLRGADGRLYFYKGMSYSMVLVPFYLLGQGLAWVTGLTDREVQLTMLTASAAGPLLGALECVLLYHLALALGFARRTAVLTALLAGLGTIIWADSKSNMSEPLLGLTITGAYLGLAHLQQRPTAGWAAFTGSCLSVLFLSQPAMLLLVVPVVTAYLLWGGWRAWRTERRQAAVAVGAYGLALLVGLGLLGWLNWLRYGSLVSAGYEGAMQPGLAIPVYIGIYGLLLSAGKSIFLYSPPLVCAAAAAPAFCRRVGMLGTLPLALLAVFLVAYGRISFWHGDGAWGPRYLIPLTGVLVVMVAAYIEETPTIGRRVVLLALIALGGVVQVIGVLTSTPAYFALLLQHGVLQSASPLLPAWYPVIFDPEFSPVVGRGMLLLSALHRLVFGESLIWTVRVGPGGDWVPISLAGYDGLNWWASWLLASSVAPQSALYVGLVLAVVAAGGLAVAGSLRALWRAAGLPRVWAESHAG
ncbi:MAG TPA: hypothetical protein VKZ60_08235 [Chloroflexota bacterium]|nr:hypothetical protein [Chloroflexota bacterium]